MSIIIESGTVERTEHLDRLLRNAELYGPLEATLTMKDVDRLKPKFARVAIRCITKERLRSEHFEHNLLKALS